MARIYKSHEYQEVNEKGEVSWAGLGKCRNGSDAGFYVDGVKLGDWFEHEKKIKYWFNHVLYETMTRSVYTAIRIDACDKRVVVFERKGGE